MKIMAWNTVCFIVATLCLRMTSADGKIELSRFTYFNIDNTLANGQCCDGDEMSKFDYYFTICLDDTAGPNDTTTCPYGRLVTGQFVKLPIVFSVKSLPDSLKIKINISDHDEDDDDDFVDYLAKVINITPAPTYAEAGYKGKRIISRTDLYFDVKSYCDVNYYSVHCDVFCDNTTGYHSCDVKTGAKLCSPGWEGTGCNRSTDDCVDHVCKNTATCVDMHQAYSCTCAVGFTGQTCEQDIDECSTDPCMHAGKCINILGSYACECSLPWTGSDCSERIDNCENNPCNNSTCTSLDTGYQCMCKNGWTGSKCDVNIDECLQDPCRNGVSCHVVTGLDWTKCGSSIDNCADHDCKNGASCVDMKHDYSCTCAGGFSGNRCEQDIDECSTDPCMHAGKCINIIGSYACKCSLPWTGSDCSKRIDNCENNPCNNSTCTSLDTGYKCMCKNGLIGSNCDVNIEDCLQDPCRNDVNCLVVTGQYGIDCSTRQHSRGDASENINAGLQPHSVKIDGNAGLSSTSPFSIFCALIIMLYASQFTMY